MNYDMSQIRERIETSREKFKSRAIIIILTFIATTTLSIVFLGKNDKIVFWSALASLALILVFRSLWIKYSPAVLFSKEVRGENILEDEYILLSYKRGFRMGSRTSIYAHHAGSRQLIGGDRTRARVYLKLEDGNIAVIDRLNTAHIDLYEQGDILYKPAGTKYPIIESREVKKQPCPLCGRINTASDLKCRCGIDILK